MNNKVGINEHRKGTVLHRLYSTLCNELALKSINMYFDNNGKPGVYFNVKTDHNIYLIDDETVTTLEKEGDSISINTRANPSALIIDEILGFIELVEGRITSAEQEKIAEEEADYDEVIDDEDI